MLELSDALIILLLNFFSVVLILTDQRFEFERKLKHNYGVDRHWWLPPLVLLLGLAGSVVSFDSLSTAFFDKFDILVLIFAFGVMSKGLGESGFFRHISYKVVKKGKGKTKRLILYIFILTSAVTFFTTNDIVVLLLTPIIVEICFQAGIRNTKMVLLAQFVAANTLSMGLLIGSPTNLIMGDALGIGFFKYMEIMLLPALITFTSSLSLLYLHIKFSEVMPFLGSLTPDEIYSVPAENPEPDFTPQMRNWILIFGGFVGLVALVTFYQLSLLWCALPAIMVAGIYWHFSDTHGNSIGEPLKHLPYGIFFFGMTFFAFAEEFSRTGFVNQKLIPVLQNIVSGGGAESIALGVIGSGAMVNLLNDLPSSALVSEIIPKLGLAPANEILVTQASLVGLNIGTYVTPIGALAGLIWFNQIRDQRRIEEQRLPEQAEKMKFPGRTDLIKFGLMHFLFTGAVAVASLKILSGL